MQTSIFIYIYIFLYNLLKNAVGISDLTVSNGWTIVINGKGCRKKQLHFNLRLTSQNKYKQNWINHLERMDNTRLLKHALNYKPREEIMDAPGNDGNASMPEQVKRLNPWKKKKMISQNILGGTEETPKISGHRDANWQSPKHMSEVLPLEPPFSILQRPLYY